MPAWGPLATIRRSTRAREALLKERARSLELRVHRGGGREVARADPVVRMQPGVPTPQGMEAVATGAPILGYPRERGKWRRERDSNPR